ncbi:Subtilisin-like protease SBT4.3 [Euphorbia peplus]|nr:Subtilisin-like protease SBT4.3 [Euphorbia peplus]
MATPSSFVLRCLVFFVCLFSVFADEHRKLYIVYMGSLPNDAYSPSSHHLNLLQEVVETSSVENLLVTSYKRSFNGFAAMLSEYEARNLAKKKGVVSLFPSRTYQLQTTNSWNFLGFNDATDKIPEAETDIVIGVIDTGIWPESASFNDVGLSPPPKKWKGICKGGNNFACNNKIIGARDYLGTASTTDRNIIDKVVLGNQKILAGKSINSFSLGKDLPLIKGIDARSPFCSAASARSCTQGCLRNRLVQGKIVVCDTFRGINEAIRAGAAGAITQSRSTEDISLLVPMPALILKADSYAAVESYMNSSRNPVANILKSEGVKDPTAPVVAYFSSRGPNLIVPDLLKPDISAPGVDILAAYPPNVPPSGYPSDTRQAPFSLLSGTSMSCPHAAGIAAYVKTFHPDWSPSAIKSAIMTTASPMNGTRDSEFAYGSGHASPRFDFVSYLSRKRKNEISSYNYRWLICVEENCVVYTTGCATIGEPNVQILCSMGLPGQQCHRLISLPS